MSRSRRALWARSVRPRALFVVLVMTMATLFAGTAPASADTAWAFPAEPAQDGAFPCLPTDTFCLAGEAAGAVVTDVWISAMLSLWGAGLWLLRLAFSVIDALATPDLSADGPLAGVYPVTFGIGAVVASVMALVQLGVAAARRDGQTLGRLLIGLVQFGLVWAGYVGVAALLVTGVSGLTTALLRSLLGIDTLAAFDPSISVGRDLVDGTVATVLGVSSIFLLVPASVGYLLLMLVREAALVVLAATSAIAAGGLLAQTSSGWFWRSLRWFMAALLVAPVAVLVLGVGVTVTEGILTGAEETSTEAAVGMAVVGCLLILLGAVCPLALFRLLAFVDPGTSRGAALRQSLAASGGLFGALGAQGGRGGGAAGSSPVAAVGGGAGTGAAARMAGERTQGETTADAATQSRFAGALRTLSAGSAQAGRLAAAVAASATDVLSGTGVGHTAPYYGQPTGGRPMAGGRGRVVGSSGQRRPGRPDDGIPSWPDLDPLVPVDADAGVSPPAVLWPAEQIGRGSPVDVDDPTANGDPPADGGAP